MYSENRIELSISEMLFCVNTMVDFYCPISVLRKFLKESVFRFLFLGV